VLEFQLILHWTPWAKAALFFLDAFALSFKTKRQLLAVDVARASWAQAHFFEILFFFYHIITLYITIPKNQSIMAKDMCIIATNAVKNAKTL
jgi:hypothetical protein